MHFIDTKNSESEINNTENSKASDNDAYKKALKTSLNILARCDNTEKALKQKLFTRGYGDETIGEVIRYLKGKGYMNECRMMFHAVEYMANVKLYGKARILAELRRKGYSSCLISCLDYSSEELADIDFQANCIKLYIKKGGKSDQKTIDFLIRYGHSGDDIRNAVKYAKELTV